YLPLPEPAALFAERYAGGRDVGRCFGSVLSGFGAHQGDTLGIRTPASQRRVDGVLEAKGSLSPGKRVDTACCCSRGSPPGARSRCFAPLARATVPATRPRGGSHPSELCAAVAP
ncbi:unnamed protein product, partial [Symbiodinium sp. CCMP2456]